MTAELAQLQIHPKAFFLRAVIHLGLIIISQCDFLEEPHRQPVPSPILDSLSYDHHISNYYPELRSGLAEGDVLEFPQRDKGADGDQRNAITIEEFKWPDATVPYEFHDKFDDPEEQKKVRTAMDYIENRTCVKFILRTKEESYIQVTKEKPGCFAKVGYRVKEVLPVNLQSPECLRHAGTLQHELLHVLGILHEQARTDRDDYIRILWENVDPKYKNDFQKAKSTYVTTYGVDYSYGSVMHYPKMAFSKNGEDTMHAYSKDSRDGGGGIGGWLSSIHLPGARGAKEEDPTVELGQRDAATWGDLEKVRRMYNCGPPPTPT